MGNSKLMGHIYAIFTILVWGSCFVLAKNMLTVFTPIQVVPLRMGLAYIVLLLMRPKFIRFSLKDELMFVLIGFTGGNLHYFLQTVALTQTNAANVSILVSLSPIMTLFLEHFLDHRGEKLSKWVYLGSLAAVVGVVLVVLNGNSSFRINPLGDLLALVAALMWAIYSRLIKKYTQQYDNFIVTRRVFLWAFLTAIPLLLMTDGLPQFAPAFASPRVWVSWLFLAVFGNALCFAIWNIACRNIGVVITNNYLYACPFITLFVGWLLLREPISLMGIIGAVLITAGVIFACRGAESQN